MYFRRPSIGKTILEKAYRIDRQAVRWQKEIDNGLKANLKRYRDIFFRQRKDYHRHIPDALGAIREAATRCTPLRPFPVQLAGAMAMNHGHITEMSTGEGKTLTAVMTAILWGWSGKPCHIITVNDYLAKRDAEWFSSLYEYCSLSVECVVSAMNPEERRHGYAQDITGTKTRSDLIAARLKSRAAVARP